ncbi:MAG: hypothetical protein Ct9H300mP31_19820 [Acidimicrobiaceae bacterium]|nr:MAG: hypothetical protein Ct9H300mP31_19820 [Acidimicrobiaceae bacterium]
MVINHVYSERQVYPLNLYLREMTTDKAVRRPSTGVGPSKT